jgi:glycosyltransferase involved in cell wall biosynthesis
VATAVGGLHDIVTSGEDGVLVRPGSAVGLARAAEAVLKDDEWRGRMVARARATVEYRFTLEAMERQLAAVYTEPQNGGSPAVQRRTKNIRSAP